MSDLTDTIIDIANSPKEIKGDMGEIVEHDLDDLIKADRYLKNQTAVAGRIPLRLAKISPGSAVGGSR